MPDGIITEAGRSFLDVGITGALCVILAAVIVYLTRTHRTELHKEREDHQRTREAQLEDIRAFAKLGESIREQQNALERSIHAVLTIVRERGRE